MGLEKRGVGGYHIAMVHKRVFFGCSGVEGWRGVTLKNFSSRRITE